MPRVLFLVSKWKAFWGPFSLLLLTFVGYVPIHAFRKAYYRACGMKIGKSAFHWRARFFAPSGIRIGDYTTIGNDAFLDGRMGLFIGDCVNIAGEVRIFTMQHDIDSPSFASVGGPITIEDYAYLGTRVTVLPGVTVHKGAVVASGSVVTKDVPEYTLVGGIPAKRIRERSKNLSYKLGQHHPFQ